MPSTKPPYPPEFRLEAVRLVKDGDRKVVDIARDLGITSETLRTWVRRYEIDNEQREGLTTSEREELQERIREGIGSVIATFGQQSISMAIWNTNPRKKQQRAYRNLCHLNWQGPLIFKISSPMMAEG